MSARKIALALFGARTRGKRYPSLQLNLRKARIPFSADTQVALAMLYAVLAGVAGAVGGVVLSWLLWLDFILGAVLTIVLTCVFGSLGYFLTLTMPGLIASERKRKIDAALPRTVGFMHALSRSGATVTDIMRELSKRPEAGEIRREAQVFMRDVEYLGRDPLTALRGLARTTPSQRFANFLEVLTSVIETGGDVAPYFASKCSELQGEMKESQRKVITSLELLAEIYVILIAFAPLLFMTLFILMGALEPASEFILYLIMYAWIPVGSFAFIVLLATATGEVPTVRLRPRRRLAFRDVPMQESDASDRLLLKSLFRRRWGTVLVTPFHAARKTPEYILLVSVPIALVYLFLDPLQGIDWYGRAVAFPPFNLIFSPLLFTLLIALLPYAVVYELGSRRAEQIERSMPDFLRALRSSLSSGLSLPPAISVVSSSELGHLTEEIKRTDREIRWGASSLEALENLESRISISPNAAQALSVVRKASEAEEDISEVLDITRNDLETRRAMKEERKGAMFVYMLIIFVTFGVFLVTVYFIVTSFVAMPVTEAEAAGLALGGMDPELVKQMYFTSTCFSAIFGGLLAAQMGHGSLRSGLKYSLVMLLVTYVVFTWTVFPARPPIVIPEEI